MGKHLQTSKLPDQTKYDHRIKLVEGAEALWGPLDGMTEQELRGLREWLDRQVAAGKIVKSSASAGAPILLVGKPDGSFRLCVDYCALNKVTVKNRYPLPLMTELRERLNKAKVFTKLDLKNGYHLVRMAEEDEEKTAFRTRFGLYHWRVMPFGLCNAPATFQSMMDGIFHDLLDNGVIVYLDDILIYSDNVEEHTLLVQEVLSRLDKAGLGVNLKKSSFHLGKIEFLGYIISQQGIEMSSAKLEEVRNWATPRKVKDVQEFLGFANFYRRFIKDFAKVAVPLTILTRKDQPWVWTSGCQKAFNQLKDSFTSTPILVHFDSALESIIETDASDYAVGAVHSQVQTNGHTHPCAFLLRMFSPAEMNYDIHNKEMVAIVLAFKEWEYLLNSCQKRITVWMDYKNLEYFSSSKVLTRHQARLSEFLSKFDFVVKY